MVRRNEPRLAGWGRLAVPGREVRSEDLPSVTRGAVLTRGLGRSYGDSSLPPPGTLEVAGSALADRILAFDPASGALRAEAGLALTELNRLFLPRGWFVPVSPGTQYVTLGGMVAADVHGKNQHVAGTIGRHVLALRMRLASGEVVECTREDPPELFRATLGGMGLTGHILEVELAMERIPSPWILAESLAVENVEAFVTELEASGRAWPYTVGWIDCLSPGGPDGARLGRGILTRGRWARPGEGAPTVPPRPKARLPVPLTAPEALLNRWTVGAFNALYFHRTRLWGKDRQRRGIVHPESFFYPLDMLRDWNRLYGRRGFTQYQCVLPKGATAAATAASARRFLERLTARGVGRGSAAGAAGAPSFLCVIKDCGREGEGLLSFPRPGISIALDLPVRDGTAAQVAALDALVLAEGGRIYLAKDAFTSAECFRAMEGERLAAFERVRRRYDPEGRLASAQSVRLMGW